MINEECRSIFDETWDADEERAHAVSACGVGERGAEVASYRYQWHP